MQQQQQQKSRQQAPQEGTCGQLECPRCSSSNTKFCYYNNYNKTQPRHFCKACKRHWTQGGTLRSVPVGGARKNKRLKPTTASTNTKKSKGNTSRSHENQEQTWQSNQQVPCLSNYVNYNSDLPSTLPFIASSSDHTCLISPLNAQLSQFSSSSSLSTASSDSHNYVSSTAVTTTGVDPSSTSVTDHCVDSLSWDYLDTLISTDLRLPWEDYFQAQELVI